MHVIASALELSCQSKVGFADLEEGLYVPAFTVYTDDLLFAYGRIGAHYCKPLIGIPLTNKYDPCFDAFVQGICFMLPYHYTDRTYDLRRMIRIFGHILIY